MPTVYLAGNAAGSDWKKRVCSKLKIDYIDSESIKEKDKQHSEKNRCNYYLHVITPKMRGFTSIVEVADDSNKRPGKTVFVFLPKDGDNEFTAFQNKSLSTVWKLVKNNGGNCFQTLDEVIAFLNG